MKSVFLISYGEIDWKKTGRTTDMGHAEYTSDGSDKREKKKVLSNHKRRSGSLMLLKNMKTLFKR